ncbi:MAG: hypothetical protein A3F72_13545 [Bacteroidetes bacterium RIFCSPLOWO2_12_FULL_35_15]|nr:MAG: hypothetical protein A3F72_13545 [Bacteroidetes bacterium RIFCSPLOWO2_12_FULL_35_15]
MSNKYFILISFTIVLVFVHKKNYSLGIDENLLKFRQLISDSENINYSEKNKLNYYSDSIKKAIDKSVNFFKNKDKIDAQSYLILDYLIRKYEIPLSIDKSKVKNAFNENGLNSSFDFFYGIIEPEAIKTVVPDTFNNPMEQSLIRALLCKEKPVDEKFLDFLEAQINSGGYQLTHAVIALIWLRENQCIINEKRTKGMINTSINLLLELAKKERYNTDIGIEAMAVLCYSGNYKKIKPFMISEVLKVQKANGSWAHSPETTITDEHTTILAFWLLLGVEYHRLNPAVKWIVK